MTKCYKLFYAEEYEHPDDIEIIAEGSLKKYVDQMIKDERINPENIEWWTSHGNKMPETEREYMDFLENDGWYIEKVEVYE